MFRHHVQVPLRLTLVLEGLHPLSQEGLRSVVEARLAEWRREEVCRDAASVLGRLRRYLSCEYPVRGGGAAHARPDTESLDLVLDGRPLLVEQSASADPSYADQIELLRCSRCGSADVEDARWLDARTHELSEALSPVGDHVFCRHCFEETPVAHGTLEACRHDPACPRN